MKRMLSKNNVIAGVGMMLLASFLGCYPNEELNVPETEVEVEMTALDQYIEENFTKEYGMAIRYRFVDRYVSPGERVTPPKLSVVRPMLDFIEKFWIEPYLEVSNGEEFFRNFVPAEIVLLGGFIYNSDGTVTLGTADAGAQITFTNVNAVDPSDVDWRDLQLQTVYHEFAHTVHQQFKLPTAYETISAAGYTSSGSWFNLPTSEALERGFVSPYASSSPNEDFAEMVSHFLFYQDFYEDFIDQESDCQDADCETTNVGKALIAEKLASITDHYEKVTGIDLEKLRAVVQTKIDE